MLDLVGTILLCWFRFCITLLSRQVSYFHLGPNLLDRGCVGELSLWLFLMGELIEAATLIDLDLIFLLKTVLGLYSLGGLFAVISFTQG